MIVARTISELHAALDPVRRRSQRVGFVPTMGNLHAGHLGLVAQALAADAFPVVSIFVNPLQFGPHEDFARYPRTEAEDCAALEAMGAGVVFLPSVMDIYPRGMERHTAVEPPADLAAILCGAMRPGHFRGVATVVLRLLNLVTPEFAVFGKKDYQQLLVIRRMVEDLAVPVSVRAGETLREKDGLAMSSRNRYLSLDERIKAPRLYEALCACPRLISAGNAVTTAEAEAVARLAASGFRPDYVSVRRRNDLAVPGPKDVDLVVLAAAHLGQTRLIDNVEFTLTRA